MKISDLHNPAAAAQVIKDLQKRFSSKVCLAPIKDCEGSAISAHTLSVESMLRPISRDAHVYALDKNLFNFQESGPGRLVLMGIRDTSVFNGFCGKHDKLLFAPIEDKLFMCSQEQIFLHAFRAVAKECYVKRKQADFLFPTEAMKKIHGLADDVDLNLTHEAMSVKAAALLG